MEYVGCVRVRCLLVVMDVLDKKKDATVDEMIQEVAGRAKGRVIN